MIQIRKL